MTYRRPSCTKVGESFLLEVRAIAIGIFNAIGTGVGGVGGPTVFGRLNEVSRTIMSSTAICWAAG